MRFRPHQFLCLIPCALALAIATGCAKPGDAGPAATQRSSSPSGLFDLDGQPFDLWHGNGDGIRVVIFTRSDCPISNRYAPEVHRLYKTYHPRGVEFFLVYVDAKEQPAAIREHLKAYEYPCPGVRDPDQTLVKQTGATVTPEAVVFDKLRAITYRGRIDDLYADVGKARPAATTHDLADAIEATLAGRPVAEATTQAIGCYIGDVQP